MAMMTARKMVSPDKLDTTTHPGELLHETLRERKMRQSALARLTGYTEKHVSQVIHGRANVTADFALAVERVLDLPAHVLMRMQADNLLWHARQRNGRAR